jgi:hypothetical protein
MSSSFIDVYNADLSGADPVNGIQSARSVAMIRRGSLRRWCDAERGNRAIAAKALCVSPQQLSNWLSGFRNPGLSNYPAIRKFLDERKKPL